MLLFKYLLIWVNYPWNINEILSVIDSHVIWKYFRKEKEAKAYIAENRHDYVGKLFFKLIT